MSVASVYFRVLRHQHGDVRPDCRAVWVYLPGEGLTGRRLSSYLAVNSLLCAVSLAPVWRFVRSRRWRLSRYDGGIVNALAVVLACPFFFSGIVVSAALTRSSFPITRIYGIDLIERPADTWSRTAAECHRCPVGHSVGRGRVALAGLLFYESAADAPATRAGSWRDPLSGGHRSGAALAALANGGAKRLRLMFVKESKRYGCHRTGRVELVFADRVLCERDERPKIVGPSAKLPPDLQVTQRNLHRWPPRRRFSGDLSEVSEYDVTNLAYVLPLRHAGAIIGVGGGRDVSRQAVRPRDGDRRRDQSSFSAVSGPPRRLRRQRVAALPGVRRRRSSKLVCPLEESFDLIQIRSSTRGGHQRRRLFVVGKRSLYRGGVDIFMDRLTNNGAFTVSRWYPGRSMKRAG